MSFKINTAVTGFTVGLVSATDGSDITTGTPVIYRTLDGGTQTAIADTSPVHEGNGQWSFNLTAAEMNAAIVGLVATHTNAITVQMTIKTVAKLVSELNDFDSSTDQVTADMVAISGDTLAANNLELQFDGTGLSGDTFPSTQSQLSGLAVGSGGISTIADSFTLTTGVEASGTVSDTYALDGAIHQITPSGSILDVYYEFDVGVNGISTSAIWDGYVQGNNDAVEVYGWNWVSSAYQQIGTIGGGSGTTIEEQLFTTTRDMTGTGANAGLARIRFESSGGDVAVNLSTDRILCEYTSVASESMILNSGVLTAATADTATLSASAIETTGYYQHSRLIIVGGTGSGQERSIVDYTSGRVCTVDRSWTTTPDTTSVYEIISAICHAATQGGSYTLDAVHISPNGSTTALVGRDGTNKEPIDDGQLANAKTVATAQNLARYKFLLGSTAVLNDNYPDWQFLGPGVTVVVTGFDISGARFENVTIAGAPAIATSIRPVAIKESTVSSYTTESIHAFIECVFDQSLTFGSADINICLGALFARNNSIVFTDSGATVQIGRFSGNADIQTMAAGNDMGIYGKGTLTINANCTGGALQVSDGIKVTDNSGGAVTITKGVQADMEIDLLEVLEDTGITLPSTLGTIEGKVDAVDANVDAVLVDTGTTLPDQITALNNISVNDVLTTQMTESYAANGTAPTLAQALMLIQQTIGDFSIAGTTITAKQLDGSSTAATYTLDDGTNPTSRTRAT